MKKINIDLNQDNTFDFPRILCANARSLSNKVDELASVLIYNDISIAVITETWLKEDLPDECFAIQGYNLVRNDRSDRRGGGVCNYVKKDISVKLWTEFANPAQESL